MHIPLFNDLGIGDIRLGAQVTAASPVIPFTAFERAADYLVLPDKASIYVYRGDLAQFAGPPEFAKAVACIFIAVDPQQCIKNIILFIDAGFDANPALTEAYGPVSSQGIATIADIQVRTHNFRVNNKGMCIYHYQPTCEEEATGPEIALYMNNEAMEVISTYKVIKRTWALQSGDEPPTEQY